SLFHSSPPLPDLHSFPTRRSSDLPPVMLTICWFGCGPSVNRENGSDTAIPGCKRKFEPSNKKNTIMKSTSSNGNTSNQPKLYSLDRKSTRLNSSHLVISYAVFCLK